MARLGQRGAEKLFDGDGGAQGRGGGGRPVRGTGRDRRTPEQPWSRAPRLSVLRGSRRGAQGFQIAPGARPTSCSKANEGRFAARAVS